MNPEQYRRTELKGENQLPDNLIQVGATFDGAQLDSAIKQATAGMQAQLQQMSDAFAKLQADSSAQITALEARMAELEASLATHAGGGREAVGGLKLAFEDTGIAVNRHVASWLARLPLLGAAFAAAFPVFAIISFADSLLKLTKRWIRTARR